MKLLNIKNSKSPQQNTREQATTTEHKYARHDHYVHRRYSKRPQQNTSKQATTTEQTATTEHKRVSHHNRTQAHQDMTTMFTQDSKRPQSNTSSSRQ